MFGHETVPADGSVALPAHVRHAAGIEPGDPVTFRVTGHRSVEITARRILTLAEALERFAIDGPIDEAADRERWEDAAAEDLFRRMRAALADRAAAALLTDHRKSVEG